MDGDADDRQRYAGDKPCSLTKEMIDGTDTSQREEEGDGIKINLQIRSLHAEHGSLEYLQTGREECRRQIEKIDEYRQTETADKHLDSDSYLQEKERKGEQQGYRTHYHIIIEAILQHLLYLYRLSHQSMKEVRLNAKGPLRQHHRWQQNGTRHIKGSHSHLIPHFLSRFCWKQGKEISIEKEDGSNHKFQSKMIKIQNLKKIYNGNTVLDIDNLGVAKGELIGLVGNNGAGKTTLLRLILDLIQADDGFVESNGQKVNESEAWKEYTGSFIDGRFLIDFLTPEEYFDFIADVYHIDDETLQERLAQFEGFMHDEILGTKKYLRDFSQGNRQKIGIIGAMIINPKVLLLDEPFNYLDPSSQMTIAHMIQRICKEHGTTVIISSHNLNFVADISTRILLLEKGKLVKDLPNADGAAIAELNEYFGIQAE